MGGWGCPHEVKGKCKKVMRKDCSPGMKGCVLAHMFRQQKDIINVVDNDINKSNKKNDKELSAKRKK